MSENTIRALTPLWLSGCGVLIFAIAVVGKVDTTAFNTAANIAVAAIGAAGGTAQSSGRRVSAENVENIDIDSSK